MIYLENNGKISKLDVNQPLTLTHSPVKLWDMASFSVDGLENLLNNITPYQLLVASLPLVGSVILKAAIIWDEKAINVVGGTFTAGAWRQRDLNTRLDPDNLVSVASNEVTVLAAGKYWIRAHAPSGYGTYYHQVRLLVNGSQVALGTSEDSITAHVITRSFVNYVATLNANDVLKLEHYCYATVTSYGFGISNTWGANVYAVMEVIQL